MLALPPPRLRRILATLALWSCLTSTAAAEQSRNLLFFFSNSRPLPANVLVDRALRETLAEVPDRTVEQYNEYLDFPRFGGDRHAETLATYLREKYEQRPPDLILAGGDQALDFLLRNRSRLFPGIPIVHVSVTRSFLRSVAPLPSDVVGVPVEFDSEGTIALALRWHPTTAHLVLVTGTSDWDRSWESRLRREVQPLAPRLAIDFLAGLPSSELAARLRELGPNTVVFSPGYFEDGTGHVFTPKEAIELVAKASTAPVYGPYDSFIGAGIVGGRMPEYDAMGRQAGQIINAIFGGMDPGALDLPELMPTRPELDWTQGARFGVRERDVAADTLVHFKPPSFWEAYRGVVVSGSGVIALQTGLIGALLFERRRRWRAAAELERSESRMTLAMELARFSSWSWDVKEEASRDALEAVHPAHRGELEKAAREALFGDGELSLEYRLLARDGTERWIAVCGRREPGTQTRLVGVSRDVTERKFAELDAERDRAALRHMARVSTLGLLSASIAHQLNQPLAAILGNAEAARMLLQREPLDLAELRDICDDIVTDDHRASDVIRRLRALFKPGEMEMAPVDVNETVREILDLAHDDLLIRRVNAVSHLTPTVPRIRGDRVALQQVLLNLIVNAADAMEGVAESDRWIAIHTEHESGQVRIRVVDRGTGISGDDADRIFEPFFSSKPSGMGIGLAISRSIVQAHGGTLTASTGPGRGSVFTATLPLGAP